MNPWIILGLVVLVIYSLLVAIDSNWAGGVIFDRQRWQIVVVAWVLVVLFWIGSIANGVRVERNMYKHQIQETIKTVTPHRAAIKAATGIDPLAEFIIKSDDTSGASDN